MNRRIRIIFFVALMFLTLISTAFAQDNAEIVKFNGVYQSVTYLGQGHYYYYYYRFFPNQTVGNYSSPFQERLSDVYKALELAPSGSGKYSVSNGEIKFSFTYAKGTVDYIGTMSEDKLHLVSHSNIINTDGRVDCDFIEVH
jgi:hypothetical protein